jgi:hypothetical protein
MQFQLQFYWWGCQKKTPKLRHLISLSRVTYWAPVEMLLALLSLNPNPIIRYLNSRTKAWCSCHLNLSKILSLCFNLTITKIWILFICCIPSLNINVLYSSYWVGLLVKDIAPWLSHWIIFLSFMYRKYAMVLAKYMASCVILLLVIHVRLYGNSNHSKSFYKL